VKKYLKGLGVLVAFAAICSCAKHVPTLEERGYDFETFTMDGGKIAPETFVQIRDRLVQSAAEKKTILINASDGGDGFAALAIGILIHRYHWDVEVVGICPSSCANWIFPAGKTKYLNSQALLVFHGGPHQANWLEMGKQVDQMFAANGAPADSVELGRKDREGNVTWSPVSSPAREEVLKFLSIDKNAPAVEQMRQFMKASDRFYEELGVNPLLPEFGQIGRYEPSYKSDKYFGFVYPPDSLRKLGISNIELKEGEWHPERHPDYRNFYEVTYP